MTSESQIPDPYEAVLADLRAKRAQIDQAIEMLDSLRGSKSSGPTTASSHHQESPVDQAGLFLGMSIVDATKKLLGMRKRAMGNPEIAAALRAGGLVMNSVDPVNTIGSILTRRFSQTGDVVRVARGTWGLKEWYPNRSFKPTSRPENSESTVIPEPIIALGEPDDPLGGANFATGINVPRSS